LIGFVLVAVAMGIWAALTWVRHRRARRAELVAVAHP
jgi:hypothetical protein